MPEPALAITNTITNKRRSNARMFNHRRVRRIRLCRINAHPFPVPTF